MTDKEQIIIDGVNVSECFHYINNKEYTCRLNHTPFHYRHCEENPNCYYKQLVRKTQEFEQLEEKYEALKLENEEGYEIVDELKQECEELKEQLQANQPTGICETCMATALLQNDKYRKALNEIERICLEDVRILADGTELRYDSLDDILNIIDKAKGR